MAIDMNAFECFVTAFKSLADRADNDHLSASLVQGACLLPNTPIEWNRKILDNDEHLEARETAKPFGSAWRCAAAHGNTSRFIMS